MIETEKRGGGREEKENYLHSVPLLMNILSPPHRWGLELEPRSSCMITCTLLVYRHLFLRWVVLTVSIYQWGIGGSRR